MFEGSELENMDVCPVGIALFSAISSGEIFILLRDPFAWEFWLLRCLWETLLNGVSADGGSQGRTSLGTTYYMLSLVLANKVSTARAPAVLIHVLKSKRWPCRQQ